MTDIRKAAIEALASDTRYRIVGTLITARRAGNKSGVAVETIAERLGMTHSAISHQLAWLSNLDVISCRKSGRNMLYQIAKTPAGAMAKKIMRV